MTHDGRAWAERLSAAIGGAVIGQPQIIERLLIALLVGGHVLLEGVPGLAKTLLATSLGQAAGLDVERIQFTPDMQPSDVVGTMIYSPADGRFSPHRGPVFAQLVLADEINRAPAKVQSALLEAMQERQVTLGGETHPLPTPFMVVVTQNPIEQDGTYPLPEAQTDRFLFNLILDYPAEADELSMLRRWGSAMAEADVAPVTDAATVLALRAAIDTVFVAPAIERYVVALVRATRTLPALTAGASPRAALALYRAARALALVRGAAHVSPALVQAVAPDVLRHRLVLGFEAQGDGSSADAVVAGLLATVPVPD